MVHDRLFIMNVLLVGGGRCLYPFSFGVWEEVIVLLGEDNALAGMGYRCSALQEKGVRGVLVGWMSDRCGWKRR